MDDKELKKQFEKINDRFDEIDKQFEKIDTRADHRFNVLCDKINKTNEKLDKVIKINELRTSDIV